MSAKPVKPDALNPKQVAMVFEEIASTADVADHLASMIMADAFETEEDAEAVKAAMQKLVQRIGLLAELYGPRCGAGRPILVKGEADAWLMPQAFRHS